MGLFDRHAGLLEAYRDVRTTGHDPFQIRMERVLSPTTPAVLTLFCAPGGPHRRHPPGPVGRLHGSTLDLTPENWASRN